MTCGGGGGGGGGGGAWFCCLVLFAWFCLLGFVCLVLRSDDCIFIFCHTH